MRWPTSPSSVAENSIVWRRATQWRRIHSTCGVNPSSAMRSASSRTTTSTEPRLDLVRLDQVDQPQRRGHDDLDAEAQLLDLVGPAGPAVHGEHALAGVGGDRLEHLGDLDRQLTRGHEHEAERPAAAGHSVIRASIGTPKRERLARAGAGPPAHVAALHRHGDGRGLDLERLGETHRGEPGVDALAARRVRRSRSVCRREAAVVMVVRLVGRAPPAWSPLLATVAVAPSACRRGRRRRGQPADEQHLTWCNAGYRHRATRPGFRGCPPIPGCGSVDGVMNRTDLLLLT